MTDKIKKSTTIGEYIIEIRENGSVTVYRIPKSARAALRECADKVGMAYRPSDTTQDLGRKLLKNYCSGATKDSIGEYFIERAANGHVDVYLQYKNTIGALREVVNLLKGLSWEDKWTTQEAGRKLVDYANVHPECILAKAPAEAKAKANEESPAEAIANEESPAEVDAEAQATPAVSATIAEATAEEDYTSLTATSDNEKEDDSWTDEYGAMYSHDKTRLLDGTAVDGEYAILPGTKVICDEAFWGADDLTEIVIPDSVIAIGDCAFWECDLRSVDIPYSVRYIGSQAFMDNHGLEDVTMPSTAKVGRFAFYGTEYYDSLPNRVESLIEAKIEPITYDFFDDNDDLDEDTYTHFVAVITYESKTTMVWSNFCLLTYDTYDTFVDRIDEYCRETFGKDSDEVELSMHYISDSKELPESSYWDDNPMMLYQGVAYAIKKLAEGDDYDDEYIEVVDHNLWDDTYSDAVHNRDGYFYLANTLFCITWANGKKQYLYVDMDGEVTPIESLAADLTPPNRMSSDSRRFSQHYSTLRVSQHHKGLSSRISLR